MDLTKKTPQESLAEIQASLAILPVANATAAGEARAYAALHPETAHLNEIRAWLAAWQGKFPPNVDHPRIIMFAANHGFAAPDKTTTVYVETLTDNSATLCQLAKTHNTDLRVYELDLKTPTQDFTKETAMEEGECVGALIYGMMAVEVGVNIITLSAIGTGSALAATTILKLLGHDLLATDETENLFAKAQSLYKAYVAEPFELLRQIGGREIAAMMGVIIASRMAHVPVVCEGLNALAALSLLHRLDKHTVQHCLYVSSDIKPEIQTILASMNILSIETEASGEAGIIGATMLAFLQEATLTSS